MVQEYAMESLTKLIQPTERKTQIRETSADVAVRTGLPYNLSSLNKVNCIVVVLWHTCCNSKDVQVEYYVLGREADCCKQIVCSLANLNFLVSSCRLSVLIKCHNNDCCSIP